MTELESHVGAGRAARVRKCGTTGFATWTETRQRPQQLQQEARDWLPGVLDAASGSGLQQSSS